MASERAGAYGSLWILSLAFGWIEASVVVYLRQIYLQGTASLGESSFRNLQVTLVSLPRELVQVELVREACTLVLLGAVAWLAGRRIADRIGAFLLSFGVWDLMYYATLWLVSGWPAHLGEWDILFLIPLPWVAPVWAPATVAVVFVLAGSYLFWTPACPRTYGFRDGVILAVAVGLILAAFLSEWRAVADQRVPERFAVTPFVTGVVLGIGWFVRAERRGVGGDTAVRAARGARS